MPKSLNTPLDAAIVILSWAVGTDAAGTDDALCRAKALSSHLTFYDNSFPGLTIIKVPYHWCTTFCPGWSRFSRSDIELVLLQFILPTVIFALVIPRKWHLDNAPVTFDFRNGLLKGLVKALSSLLATGIVASSDMILWIGVVLALAGPMILSGIEEMYLDIVSLRTLAKSHSGQFHQLTSEERLSILVAVLCGNFEDDTARVPNLQATLSSYHPITPNAPILTVRKAQLESIMNGQASFGSAVGIPTLFFLAGLLYNAFEISDQTASGVNWTPYAIWLMTMVYVVLVSAAQLTGNNPSVANMLVKSDYRLQDRPWWNIVANYYDEEISPAPMYDRATTKKGWIRDSTAYRNRNWFREEIKLGGLAWLVLVVITGFTTLFASIMAYSIAYYVPWPRQGCRSFSYLLYIALQALLVLLRVLSSIGGQSLFSRPDPVAYNMAGSAWFKMWQIIYRILTGLAFAIAFFVSFVVSITQIFGVYNNCFCRTPVSSWTLPKDQRIVQVTSAPSLRTKLENKHYADNITLSAVLVTGVLCYFGWWYQKVMRRAVAVELNRL